MAIQVSAACFVLLKIEKGKTSLLHVLKRLEKAKGPSPTFKNELRKIKSTHGAAMSSFKGTRDFGFVVYDFAGQQEYATSHRFASLSHLL
jgi:hypothetical protein